MRASLAHSQSVSYFCAFYFSLPLSALDILSTCTFSSLLLFFNLLYTYYAQHFACMHAQRAHLGRIFSFMLNIHVRYAALLPSISSSAREKHSHTQRQVERSTSWTNCHTWSKANSFKCNKIRSEVSHIALGAARRVSSHSPSDWGKESERKKEEKTCPSLEKSLLTRWKMLMKGEGEKNVPHTVIVLTPFRWLLLYSTRDTAIGEWINWFSWTM